MISGTRSRRGLELTREPRNRAQGEQGQNLVSVRPWSPFTPERVKPLRAALLSTKLPSALICPQTTLKLSTQLKRKVICSFEHNLDK